ncbi:MAG: DEAD/DEAH box helicase, partial [Methanobacteriaceae archaeon]
MIILEKRKRLWEMYPIGSPKGVLNSKRKPKFIGILKFKKIDAIGNNSNSNSPNSPNSPNSSNRNSNVDNDINQLKLNKFILKKEITAGENGDSSEEYVEKLLPPSQAIKVLKKQAVFLTSKDPELEAFLDSLNIKYRFTNICKHCLFDGNITVLSSDFSYMYHNQKICKLCAEDTIKRELKLNGFDKKVFRNFKRVLDKTGNLDDVLKIMNPKFDSVKNKNLTLFDKINIDTKKFPKIAINRLKLPSEFKEILNESKNEYLLPVQYLAIKNGLLKNKDLLIVSATGSGKTLIGELAGIPKAINGGKFLFLTPLVALSNQKYRDFNRKYGTNQHSNSQLNLKTSIKVGMNRVKAKGELKLPKTNIGNSDIVVGTYEGIDFLLRSGKYEELANLETVLIDEIHTLADEERGSRLNGLIKRIKNLFPNTQIIGLSATIKNPKYLANEFNMDLVEYPNRPVPLERHLIFARSEVQKKSLIKKLVIAESKRKSSKGFKGQTIIFTNSRRKTHKIADS